VSYLIDANIIPEIRKGARCDAHVSAWYASIPDEDIFLSTRNDRDVAGLCAKVINPFGGH
jgi:hypothetical protein